MVETGSTPAGDYTIVKRTATFLSDFKFISSRFPPLALREWGGTLFVRALNAPVFYNDGEGHIKQVPRAQGEEVA